MKPDGFAIIFSTDKDTDMIDYNEELAKFQPSLEVDQAEEAIYNNDMTDLADILDMILKSIERNDNQRG